MRKRININKYRDYCENKHTQNSGELLRSVYFHESGAPNENIVQNHLNIALLNVF